MSEVSINNNVTVYNDSVMTYGTKEYVIGYNPSEKKWYLRRADKDDAKEFVVYDGELEVRVIRDNVLGKDAYILRSNYTNVFGFSIGEVINEFIDKDPGTYNERFIRPFLKYMFIKAKPEPGYIVSGFYRDGFAEGLIPYPALTWGL
jgi:hypothetical protein